MIRADATIISDHGRVFKSSLQRTYVLHWRSPARTSGKTRAASLQESALNEARATISVACNSCAPTAIAFAYMFDFLNTYQRHLGTSFV